MIYKIRAFIEAIKRAYAYAKLGYGNYDFDALSIENYLLFKLQRVEHCIINGDTDLTVEDGPKKMKALRICIKILKKLTSEKYNRFSNLHEAKWGELVVTFEPNDGKLSSRMLFSRPNAITPEQIEQETKEQIEAMYADDREERRYRKLLYTLINTYIRTWWD